jgi:biotin carboxyl carrier protein
LVGDAPVRVDLDAPSRPLIEPAGPGAVLLSVAVDGPASDGAGGAVRPARRSLRAVVVPSRRSSSGIATVEIVVDGWRFELEVEDGARAEIRWRATREADTLATSGPTEIRAIIPGRIAAVHVVVGDVVEAGQSLLVVEAMKMQNELRAARAGTVARVAVGAGETIDNGDLLVVLS